VISRQVVIHTSSCFCTNVMNASCISSRYGRPITYEVYYALPYGPVASNAMDLIESDSTVMKAAGIAELPFETETIRDAKNRDITYIRAPRRKVDFDLFSKSDLRVFDEIIAKYGKLSFDKRPQEKAINQHRRVFRTAKDHLSGRNRAKYRRGVGQFSLC